jgi:hypothetical protein
VKWLCSICVKRDADTLDDIDGKHRPVCRVCNEQPAPDIGPARDEEGPRARALRAIRHNPGATFVELREWLGLPGGGCNKHKGRGSTEDSRAANKYCAAVARLVKEGLVERCGAWPNWTYRVVEQRRRAA